MTAEKYTYNYYYNGDILAGFTVVGKNSESPVYVKKVVFMYDENGDAFGFSVNGNEYFYVKNAQNDVVRIVDSANETVVLYQYDSWGKLLSCEDISENQEVSFLNPYTYRSYFYDSEAQLYYLNSRYYNPYLCRYLSADKITDNGAGVLGYNIFMYAANNPMAHSDPSGNFVISAIVGKMVGGAVVGAIVGAVSSAAASAIKQYAQTRTVNKKTVLREALVGAASGAVTGALSGAFGFALRAVKCGIVAKTAVNIIGSGVIGAAGCTIEKIIKKEKLTFKDQAVAFSVSAVSATLSSLVTYGVNDKSFLNATKHQKQEYLGGEFTHRQIRMGAYNNSLAYYDFMNEGFGAVETTINFGISTIVEIFSD